MQKIIAVVIAVLVIGGGAIWYYSMPEPHDAMMEGDSMEAHGTTGKPDDSGAMMHDEATSSAMMDAHATTSVMMH